MQDPDIDAIKDNVRTSLNTLFHHSQGQSSSAKPFVCLVCDAFVNPDSLQILKKEDLKEARDLLIINKEVLDPIAHEDQEEHYKYIGEESEDWMQDMILSPRGVHKVIKRTKGFVTCSTCFHDIKSKQLPPYSIINNYMFGFPPPCLLALTEVELAIVSPVRSYGFFFTYSGGKHMNLKGVMSYFRVKEESIAQSVAQMCALPRINNIVFYITGSVTEKQRDAARRKAQVTPEKLKDAIQWLTTHHASWKNVDLNQIFQTLPEPIIYDDAKHVDSQNTNIEQTEVFSVYYPEGQMRQTTGGTMSPEDFLKLVEKNRANPFDIQIQSNLNREIVPDYMNDNFVNSCLLQFPYGRGGMNETRLRPRGSRVDRVDTMEYVMHLSKISLPMFHESSFVLKLYTLKQRQRMLKMALLQKRGKANATNLVENLTITGLTRAVRARDLRQSFGDATSQSFLSSVQAMTKALPHSNAAAGSARLSAETMMLNHGMPSYFVTVTPDTDNSFLLQVLSGETIDDDELLFHLDADELKRRYSRRQELRLKYPGLSSLNFEYVLQVVLKDVIGWDFKTGKATEEQGTLGECEACFASVEEQGRKKLHVHIIVWVKGHRDLIKRATSTDDIDMTEARQELLRAFDSVASTKLFPDQSKRGQERHIFDHECQVEKGKRLNPKVVSDQDLRNLRHKAARIKNVSSFAYCPHCEKKWTYEEMVQDLIKFDKKILLPHFEKFPDPTGSLFTYCVLCQNPNDVYEADSTVTNAAYNVHLSFHTASCFKSKQKSVYKKQSETAEATSQESRKREHSKTEDCECRYGFPAIPNPTTSIRVVREKMAWFDWNGNERETNIIEVIPARGPYDLFQNVSFIPVSETLYCNTNISFITPGPLAVYSTGYVTKKCQDEDTEEYNNVLHRMKVLLQSERHHETDNSEALRMLIAGAIAHNKENVVSAPMAAFLTRYDSRFLMSDTFVWLPLQEIDSLLRNYDIQTVNGTVQYVEGKKIFNNTALHYLCRSSDLEDFSCFDFYKEFECKLKSRKEQDDFLPFQNTDYFQHPSVNRTTGFAVQGVKHRMDTPLIKLAHWMFPDTALFQGNILEDHYEQNLISEKYARFVLILFSPFRCNNDLYSEGSHTVKLREIVAQGMITEKRQFFLQNLQDVRSNALRLPRVMDELQDKTVSYAHYWKEHQENMSEECDDMEVEEEMQPEPDSEMIDKLLEAYANQASAAGSSNYTSIPPIISFRAIRNKGEYDCGFRNLCQIKTTAENTELEFLIGHEAAQQHSAEVINENIDDSVDETMNIEDQTDVSDGVKVLQDKITKRDIMKIIYSRNTVRERHLPMTNQTSELPDANGTAKSIIQWGVAAGLDREQRRSFEIATAVFVLTYYKRAQEDSTLEGRQQSNFDSEKQKLLTLSSQIGDEKNLVFFLHGPAGSGKTSSIDLLQSYAREYCEHLETRFDKDTIAITAMSGVAATLLQGYTTHSRLYLNQKKDITHDQMELWENTRILIIDEISFATVSLVKKIERNLRLLLNSIHQRYGGMNVIFCGDMRQLEAFGTPIYDDFFAEFHDYVNCYIELEGIHRFREDNTFGLLMRRWRNEGPTREDLELLNKHCLVGNRALPDNLQYTTYYNRDRDAINTALFEVYCESAEKTTANIVQQAIVILSDDLQVKTGSGKFISFLNSSKFWLECGEDNCKLSKGKGRMDPALKLYQGCPVMLTQNHDVPCGKANGTKAFVNQVVLKPGATVSSTQLKEGIFVLAVRANQVEKIVLKHENSRIKPDTFEVYPTQFSFLAELPRPAEMGQASNVRDKIFMKAVQFPFVSNSATTGHKLQGCTVTSLFIHNWRKSTTSWNYVVIGRVKTMSGLFFRRPLQTDPKLYRLPERLIRFNKYFKENKQPSYFTNDQYRQEFGVSIPLNSG